MAAAKMAKKPHHKWRGEKVDAKASMAARVKRRRQKRRKGLIADLRALGSGRIMLREKQGFGKTVESALEEAGKAKSDAKKLRAGESALGKDIEILRKMLEKIRPAARLQAEFRGEEKAYNLRATENTAKADLARALASQRKIKAAIAKAK